jgi:two-component system, chemotaxis family, CheB/CheR fusion protein
MSKKDVRILLAEDEPNLQFLVIHQLTALGYLPPDIADTGMVAVEKVRNQPYDIILMDVMMPDLDGLAAAERIRRHETSIGINRSVIVGMTAFALRERCLSAGMDDFLQKPVLLEDMERMLNTWIKKNPELNNEGREAGAPNAVH